MQITQADEERIIQIARITFQAHDSAEVKQAEDEALHFMTVNYPKSFSKV